MNILRTITLSVVALALLGATATPSYAGRFAQNHPRRAQVLGRDRSLNRTLWSDRGHLGGNFGKLEAEDKAIRQQEQADARANGGYITKAQQAQLNHEENGLLHQMNQDYRNASAPGTFGYNHPRRAQVLGEDNSLRNEINADKGNLDGHYGQLMSEDRAIRAQEQRDARINGGYITTGQENRLMNEESALQNQINRDQ